MPTPSPSSSLQARAFSRTDSVTLSTWLAYALSKSSTYIPSLFFHKSLPQSPDYHHNCLLTAICMQVASVCLERLRGQRPLLSSGLFYDLCEDSSCMQQALSKWLGKEVSPELRSWERAQHPGQPFSHHGPLPPPPPPPTGPQASISPGEPKRKRLHVGKRLKGRTNLLPD